MLLFIPCAGNCPDFNIYVTKAFGKLTKYETYKLFPDNLKAVAKPNPTAKSNNKEFILLKPG